MAIPPRFSQSHGLAGQLREFPLRPGGHGGGKGEAPPLPEGPREQGEANTGPEVFRRGSRDKNPHQLQAGEGGGGGWRETRREGGGARGARARTKCPDAALRQSEARNGGRGWGEAEETRSSLTPHSKSPGSVLSTPDPSERSMRESTQSPRQRRQRSQTKWRHRPPLSSSRCFPPEVREPTLAHHHRPTENTKALMRGNEASQGRAIAASRSHIPFEAMSAHARTGRQATGFQTTAKGRRED